MNKNSYHFTEKIWLYPSEHASWYFVSIPKKIAESIKANTHNVVKKGWGSISVIVTVGRSEWKTSLFPDSRMKTYILPIKASMREKEQVSGGSAIKVYLKLAGK